MMSFPHPINVVSVLKQLIPTFNKPSIALVGSHLNYALTLCYARS